MRFVDEAEIRVEAGNGGNGVATFRRENTFQWVALMAAMAATEAVFI